MFKSLDSIASVVGIFMYLTISKFKQVLRSLKGLDYNTVLYISLDSRSSTVNFENLEFPLITKLTCSFVIIN